MSDRATYESELAALLEVFGANVRRVRHERDYSQERLADQVRLHRTEIGKIEQGIVEPRLSTLVVLADGLGVSLDELVAGIAVPQERKPSPSSAGKPLGA
jgi:transcriptional regulator with XRE-family HTH domain